MRGGNPEMNLRGNWTGPARNKGRVHARTARQLAVQARHICGSGRFVLTADNHCLPVLSPGGGRLSSNRGIAYVASEAEEGSPAWRHQGQPESR